MRFITVELVILVVDLSRGSTLLLQHAVHCVPRRPSRRKQHTVHV